MVRSQMSSRTLANRLWVQIPGNTRLRIVLLVLIGTILLAVSAHIQVPFWPVKMSMQSFMVLALAVVYGGRIGTATVAAYLVEGAVGLPVFQSGGGLACFGGPTAGYLAGFVVATGVVGSLSERGAMHSVVAAFGVLLLGDAIIMVLGTAWLSTLIGFEKALSAGLLIFLPAEAVKVTLAAVLTRMTARAI
ncbi:biotin transporter BioY [Microvirga calopogonii]|uniref:biotin transporter BioY n=1 Tax=Microvirga calopogonii TaxID=2078013 RepID=UPI00197B5813|nr:biotin transporter BioY [Microvirga calopogonii]